MILNSNRFTPFFRQYLVVGAANLIMFNVGVDLMWSSPMLVKLSDTTDPVLSRPINDIEASWIVTIISLSTLTANFLAVYLQDKLGRKACLMLSGVPRLLCYIILITTRDPWLVIVARFFSGFADGLVFCVLPVYITEISSKEIRGRLGAITMVTMNLGCLFILSAGPYLKYNTLNIIIFCICLFTIAPMYFVPESPYFIFTKGKKDETKKVLEFLRETPSLAKEEMLDYEQLIDNDENIDLREVLQSKSVMKALILVTIIFGILFQWTGYGVTNSYLQTILVSTETNISPESISVIIGFVKLLSSIAALFLNDRFNRKPITCITMLMVFLGMLLLGIFFWITESTDSVNGLLNLIPLLSLILIFVGYNAGLAGTVGTLLAEIFEGPARAFGCGCAILMSSISAFSASLCFTPLINSTGSGPTFWIFSCNCLILITLFMVFFPETKGKSFAEIQAALGKEPNQKAVMINEKV